MATLESRVEFLEKQFDDLYNDKQIVRNLERRAMNEDFDELPQLNLSLKDIDTTQFEKVMKDFHKSVTKDSLETLRLVHKEQGKVVPTNAGIILFGKNRRKFFPESYIQCGRFSGTTRVNILDSQDIDTSPILAVDEVMGFVKKHALHGLVIDVERFGSKHFDNWNVPLNAIREIVINALMHQDYSVKSTRMQVAVYDDRIEIVSPGGLVPGMTIEDMKKVKSIRRNSAIAGVFKELKITETWGSGAQRAVDEIVGFGLKEPDIVEDIDGLKWTVWVDIKEPHDFKIDHPLLSDNEQEVSDKSATISLTVRRMADKIIKYLNKYDEIDTSTAAKLLKKSQPTARNLLRELAEVGELVAKGANKNRTYSLSLN
ncbi:hypothetical protein FACS1894125_5140 [Actinomycetota bacterium]|nr:hypothetical protein FACS1894125_5140 [Actinomycetota bacterium]